MPSRLGPRPRPQSRKPNETGVFYRFLRRAVNPKLVYRLMREDNLLCVRRRKFVVTTDSDHTRKVYPNLAPGMIVTAPDQLWRADITYIRLRDEFVFLAVILDAYSRRVIGWALDRTIEDDLTLTALRMALSRRAVQPGLVHHSDRGSQYASSDYTDLLKANGIDIRMSRKGNPWDNAACESFMKTLKYEEVLRNEYRDLAEARADVADVVGWLKTHSVKAEPLAVAAKGDDAAQLSAIAQDHNADLVVAGAYGHSRLREWVLGGVTRDLLLHAGRCSLLSH